MKDLLGALSELVPAARPSPHLRDRLLASVARPRLRFAPLYGALGELFDLGDAALSELFERAATTEAWQATLLPGTRLLHLPGGARVAGADNGLVRIDGGLRFPMHRHLGEERVLLLQGGYIDEPSGRVYRAGDLHVMSEGESHAYTTLPEAELWLAVSVVGGVEVEGYGRLSPAG
jgi:hypothetical protein